MASPGEFGSLRHLAGRFFGALSPAGPSPEDEAWALGWLLPGEQALWQRMSGPDRRHAVGVARDTLTLLDDGGPAPDRAVVASALLHDVGKVASGLGTWARAMVTAMALVVGRTRLAGDAAAIGDAVAWSTAAEVASGAVPASTARPGWRERVRRYFVHDRIGGAMLRAAGSDPATVAWAEEHHLPPERWTLDRRTADALKAADGD
jgi:hypothetical protein